MVNMKACSVMQALRRNTHLAYVIRPHMQCYGWHHRIDSTFDSFFSRRKSAANMNEPITIEELCLVHFFLLHVSIHCIRLDSGGRKKTTEKSNRCDWNGGEKWIVNLTSTCTYKGRSIQMARLTISPSMHTTNGRRAKQKKSTTNTHQAKIILLNNPGI